MWGGQKSSPCQQPDEKGVNIVALAASGPLVLSAGILIVVAYAYALTVGLLELRRDPPSRSSSA